MPKSWEKLITFDKARLVKKYNGADIPDGTLQTATDVIFDNGVLEMAPGRTVVGTQLESGAAIDGLFRSWDKDGNKDLICVVNGKLKYWTGAAWDDLVTGLTASKRCDFLNSKDRTFMVDGYNDAYEFYPRDNTIRKAGIEPPRYIKKVAYFETDETFVAAEGDTTVFRPTERTGTSRRSMKVTATAGNTTNGYVGFAATDFSQFSNGKAVTDNDYICVSIFHRTRAYISVISIYFYTSAGAYYQVTLDNDELDQFLLRDNQWTDLKIKRSRFAATGAPNWASITRVYFNVTAVTGSAIVNFDNCYIKNTPPVAYAFSKAIDLFEGPSGDWTVSNCTLTDNLKYKKIKQGSKSLKFVRSGATASFYKAATLDLTEWIDGVTSPTSDEIVCWVFVEDTTNLTSITLRLYSDTSTPKHFSKEYTVASGAIKNTTTGAWTELRTCKKDFTDTGTADWSAINRIYVEIATTGACTIFFDMWQMEEQLDTKTIASMETTETWTDGAAVNLTASTQGGWNTDARFYAKPSASIFLKVPCKSSYSAKYASAVDLSIFAAAETSTDDDIISFWMYWTIFTSIKSIEIQMDINDGNYTDYMTYTITKDEIAAQLNRAGAKNSNLEKLGLYFEIEKGDFNRVGATGAKSWATYQGVKFIVSTVDKQADPVKIYFDDLHMRRRRGLTGLYQFAVVYFDSTGEPSAPSEWSDIVTLNGTRAFIQHIPLSADSRVVGRYIFRRGGDLGDEARLDATIWDNTTTEWFCDNEDYQTGFLLSDDSIPTGTIRFAPGAKFGPVFKGRATCYGDPNHLDYLYFSNPDYHYAWSELQAWKFDSAILDCWLDDNVYFVNTKNGIRRIAKDFGELTSGDIEETHNVKHSVSPWASCQAEEVRAVVSFDGVYLYDGLQHILISDEIEGYFAGATYNIDEAVAIYRDKHLYISIKTTGGTRSLLDCYLPEKKWRYSADTYNCFCILDANDDNGELYAGTTNGYVYQLDTGYATTAAVVTKDYQVDKDNPFAEAVVKEIWVMARSASATPGGINFQFRMNQTLNVTITKLLPSSGNLGSVYTLYHAQLMGVENYLKGSKIGLSIANAVASKHFSIESIRLVGEISPLPMTYEE